MRQLLIKLTEEHHIIVDYSEILGNGEWLYCLRSTGDGYVDLRTVGNLYKSCRIKIDFSDESFESWGYINNQGVEQYIHYPEEMSKVIYSTLPLEGVQLVSLSEIGNIYKLLENENREA